MASSVFQLVGEIAINADSAHRAIDRTNSKASTLTTNFNKVGKVALKVGKATIAGAAAVATGVGALLKASVQNYAEYEQLVGGVETLFKESSGKVMEYANNAYKTAGMSANEYMETVTSFSASLIQSMKGNTEGAADVANMALTDMSDNANKMGTSMASIQNAYQGFAKQNYTMLDNLKLGYGGTQSEMKRLLKDAQKISGQKYNMKNFDDIIEAIHVIQTEMGITGTTAEEASKTISGSFTMLSTAWQNLLTGASDKDADMDALVKNVFDAAETVAVNIGKVLPVFAKHLGAMIGSLGEYAGEKIKSVWTNTVYPKIQNALKVHFGIDLPDWETAKDQIVELWQKIDAVVGGLFRAVFQIFMPDENGEESTAARIISWWGGILESIGGIFKAVFSIFTPAEDGENTADKISQWWNGVVEAIGDLFKAYFSIFMPDENDESTAGRILSWWAGILTEVGNLVLSPFGISFPDAVGQISAWWEGVKGQLSLALGFTVSPKGAGKAFGDAPANKGTYNGTSADFADYILSHGSHASGLDRVPFDGYRAILHKDEAVLRASEAAVWRGEKRGAKGTYGSGQVVNVTQNISAVPMSTSELIAETKFALSQMRFAT